MKQENDNNVLPGKPTTKKRLIITIAIPLCVILFTVHLLLSTCTTGLHSWADRRGTIRAQRMRAFSHAIKFYLNDNDFHPYSANGEASALYLLKPYLEHKRRLLPDLVFDNDSHILRNCPYEYINLPDIEFDSFHPERIILAEKEVDENGGRHCVIAAGFVSYVKMENESLIGLILE